MPPQSPLRAILKKAEVLSISELEALSQSIHQLLEQRRSQIQADSSSPHHPNAAIDNEIDNTIEAAIEATIDNAIETAIDTAIEVSATSKLDRQPNPLHGWREEYRKCGKPNCWCAQGEKSHGPYWYRSVRKDGKVSKEYWGRYLRAQQTSTEDPNPVESNPDPIVE
ncbi:DUF6788 family protein [Alkalinema pantanalense CENA528]